MERTALTSLTAVIAEKPSVARDIAKVLGATERGEGFLRGNGYLVTWAIGHLVTLAQPHEIQPEWKRWSRDHLPMLPREWPLVVPDETRKQIVVYAALLVPLALGPALMGFGGPFYTLSAIGLGAVFLALALKVYHAREGRDADRAAKQLFGFSILYLFGLFAALLAERSLALWLG